MSVPRDAQGDDYDDGPRAPEPTADQLAGKKASVSAVKFAVAVSVICGVFLVLGVGGMLMNSGPHGVANRMTSNNNLKQIGLGIHNYNDTWGQLPHNTYTRDGKPLLSWRVHL